MLNANTIIDTGPETIGSFAGPGAQLVDISASMAQGIDRQLGYAGNGRFVLFYYEARGEEVMWQDCRTSGFGTGGWRTWLAEIKPLTRRYGVRLGDEGRPEHALVIDRQTHEAFFTNRRAAEAIVNNQHPSRKAG